MRPGDLQAHKEDQYSLQPSSETGSARSTLSSERATLGFGTKTQCDGGSSETLFWRFRGSDE